jgi:hypothetical protein
MPTKQKTSEGEIVWGGKADKAIPAKLSGRTMILEYPGVVF